MSVDIGGRLRFIRARHKLSQRELAKRAGVTNSTISLIESNQMNPSVGALKRILDGIPMGLAEFFALEPESRRKIFYRGEELTEVGKKPISYRQVGDNLFGRSLQILKERYEPGSDTGRVHLVHDGEEGGIVISGKLEAIWICGDAFRRVGGGGSCGVPSIPLGKVATLNPIEGGNFELTIPDFTEDPVFRSNSFNFGFLILSLKNERVECTVGAIVANGSNGSKRGLEIETDYPDPVVCAPIH